jgi:hypothetical protein
MNIGRRELEYMERIAGVKGDEAVNRWLYFTETINNKTISRPRFVEGPDGKLIPWDSSGAREINGLPKGTTEPTRGELLNHVVRRIRRETHPVVTAKKRLAEAIAELPPSPCVKFACPKQDDCATRQLACYAFWWWSSEKGRTATSPWTFMDYGLTADGEPTKRRVKVTTREPVATRGMFNEVFSRKDKPGGRPALK